MGNKLVPAGNFRVKGPEVISSKNGNIRRDHGLKFENINSNSTESRRLE